MKYIKCRCWNGKTMISPDHIDRQGIAHWHENSIPESSSNVMFYIGKDDRRQTAIFEGDIVRGTGMNTGSVREVHMHTFCLFPFIPSDKCEIIGNVWKNPELLGFSKNPTA